MNSLVSIITPTWQRHDLLFSRCIPSVQAQDYPDVEHIIVSDGPDPELRRKISALYFRKLAHPVRFFELPVREEGSFGCRPRRHALEQAKGSLIGYNDDDDELLPYHVSRHAAALEACPNAGFSRSWMMQHFSRDTTIIGCGPVQKYNIGTPMVVHRRELLGIATWGEPSVTEDWDLFSKWLRANVAYVPVEEITLNSWPAH